MRDLQVMTEFTSQIKILQNVIPVFSLSEAAVAVTLLPKRPAHAGNLDSFFVPL
jgi:hypothetical protein